MASLAIGSLSKDYECCSSDAILEASHLTLSEFRQAIALHLFETDRLTVGYASKLAEMPLNAFRHLLKQRHIPLDDYDVEALELDLRTYRIWGDCNL